MAEYIELAEVKKRFAKRLDWLKRDIHDEYSRALYDCCEVDVDLIDEIPAADVAPVVHGKWDVVEGRRLDNAICSNCGRRFQAYYEAYRFCPNCGAKMDGGDNDAAD